VLRTAKKPHRGPLPTVANWLPKGCDGEPWEHVPEIRYTVVDLPARDFGQLVGGTELRLVVGMLKKMTEDLLDEFPEALLPLLDIADGEIKSELTKELLIFVDKVFKAHNRRLDAARVSQALKPIFQEKENPMIKGLFEEKFDDEKDDRGPFGRIS